MSSTTVSPAARHGVTPKAVRAALFFCVVLLMFFASGACGLLYQVVWTRKLVLLFGTTAYAVSTVLTIFFAGLGLGSWWGGRLADRSARPLAVYAVFEIIIGLWALAFIACIGWGESAVVAALKAFAGSRGMGVGFRALMAAALLMVPVTLMGATLPLLGKFVAQENRSRGLRLGFLYAVNTLGAVTGCAFAGFYCIEHFGYTLTTLLGAVVNVGVGILAILLFRKSAVLQIERRDESTTTVRIVKRPADTAAGTVLLAFAISGCCALALEVVWTRLLTIVFIGTTYAYTTMLSSLLCGIAVGSIAASFIADRRRHPVSLFGVAEVLAGLACLLMLAVFAQMPERHEALRSAERMDFERLIEVNFNLSFTALFIPTFLFGTTFPLAVKAFTTLPASLGRDVGRLYSANTLGGVLGALLGGYVLLPRLGAHRSVVLLGIMLVCVGASLILACPTRPRATKAALGFASAGLLAATWYFIPADAGYALNKQYVPETHEVIHYKEGVEGTVVVSEPKSNPTQSNRILFINSVQATQSIERGVRMNRFQGALPMLFNRTPKTALFMCFGSGITAGTLGLSNFDRIDAVEISRDVLDAAPLFGADNFRVWENSRINFVVDDGRNFLLTTDNRYDVITFEPMPLAVAGVSTFYTREFYELCLAHLTDGGLVSQWVPLHSLNAEVVTSLVRTLGSVFPEYCAWFVNSDLFIIASNKPIRIDYEHAAAVMNAPELGEGLRAVGFHDVTELLSCFFMSKSGIDTFSEGGMIMTDDRPWAEFIAPRLVYNDDVAESLRLLRPLFESPSPLVDFGKAPPSAAEALQRRYEARVHTLEGIETIYEGIVSDKAEICFQQALDSDPGDVTALAYLRDIAVQRMSLYIRWDELDEAESYLDSLRPYLGQTAEYHLMQGDLRFAQGDRDAALEAYRHHLAEGGHDARAVERVGSPG